ncbi:MAG: hypothetical protein WB508_09600, partial [Aeromicrobium sp.]|uniref:hypothetical protein n=1 Tax=Aeromicrobium sp. TaxID=1871063 RepID=UPI003C343847
PPLSLREALADAGARADSDDLTDLVPRVAFEVAHRINAATPITPAALVTFGLLDNDGRAMTLAETLAVLEPLVAYVRLRQLPLTADVDLGRPEGLRRALATLVREGVVVEYTGGLEPVYAIAPDRQHEAAFYRNTVTHYFINRAILEVALVQACGDTADANVVSATWTRALALRDLLKYEFFFATKSEFDTQMRYETDVVSPGWAEQSPTTEGVIKQLSDSHLLLAHRVIGPFLEAYSVVADRLVTREPAAPLDGDGLIAESLGVAHQRWLQQDLHSPESISKDLMGGALKLAGNRDLVAPGGDELVQSRQRFADELAAAVRAIEIVRSLALKD